MIQNNSSITVISRMADAFTTMAQDLRRREDADLPDLMELYALESIVTVLGRELTQSLLTSKGVDNAFTLAWVTALEAAVQRYMNASLPAQAGDYVTDAAGDLYQLRWVSNITVLSPVVEDHGYLRAELVRNRNKSFQYTGMERAFDRIQPGKVSELMSVSAS
jgi:hypothetical protein